MFHRFLLFAYMFITILIGQIDKVDSTLIKNPKTALYLSLIPGGGQLYNGKLLKGSLLLAFESYVIYSWLENSKIYKNYNSSNHILPKNRYLEKRNKYAWWVIFVYFYSMIDAIVDAHLSPFDQIMNTAIEDTKGESNE